MDNRFLVLTVLVWLLCNSVSLSQEGGQEAQPKSGMTGMLIKYASVFVEDQAKALEFYTEKLGFVRKEDTKLGEFRWLTVVSPLDPEGAELLLEPNANKAAKTFQKAIFDQGIPATSFAVKDTKQEFERLKAAGVRFSVEPTDVGTAIIAVFDDTCGNLIQIAESKD